MALILLAIIFVGLLFVFQAAYTKWQVTLPGPKGLPIIGHLHLLGSQPHKSLRDLSIKHGPIMFLKLGSVHTVVASSIDIALQFLRNNDRVCAARPMTTARRFINPDSIAWTDYGEKFRSMRRVFVMELLTPKRLEAAQRIRSSEINIMIKSMLEECKQPIKVLTKLSFLTTNVVTLMAMRKKFFSSGAASSEAQEFKEMIHEFFTLAGLFNIGEFIPFLSWFDIQGYVLRMKNLSKRFDTFLDAIVEEHKSKGPSDDEDDYVDVLLKSNFSPNTIKTLVQDILATGTDTVSITMEWALVELLKKPSVLKRAQEELDVSVGRERRVTEGDIPKLNYLNAIVKEVLRLHPPGPLMIPHQTTDDCKVGGYKIPKNTRIIVNLLAIFRDERSWHDAETFKPERFIENGEDFALSPFGAGRRMCPGLPLAQCMLHITLAHLLQCFTWTLPFGVEADQLDMSEIFGLTIPKKVPLEAVVTPRLPLHLLSS